MRVVSLLPSATELLYALGVEPVGVSHECDYPPQAQSVPTVIETSIDADATSEEINEQVATAESEGGVYDIDRETLVELEPDILVSQGICDVCAVDDSRIRQTVDELGLDAEIITTDPHSLDDLFADIERLGSRLDRETEAMELRESLQERVDHVTALTPDDGPDVAVLDWLDPVMVAGHWIPGMVQRCGGTYGLAAPGDRSRPREWTEIREYDPDVLVAAPCGFDLDQTRENIAALTEREGWKTLSAVQSDRVYLMDGHNYVNRPGPRLVETLELFAGVLSPGTFETPASAVSRLSSIPSQS